MSTFSKKEYFYLRNICNFAEESREIDYGKVFRPESRPDLQEDIWRAQTSPIRYVRNEADIQRGSCILHRLLSNGMLCTSQLFGIGNSARGG